MERQSQERVDRALANESGWSSREDFVVLAAEVRALLEEVDSRQKLAELWEAKAQEWRHELQVERDKLREELAEARHTATNGGRCDYWRENRKLREELAEALESDRANAESAIDQASEVERMQESIDLYRATIARVEALESLARTGMSSESEREMHRRADWKRTYDAGVIAHASRAQAMTHGCTDDIMHETLHLMATAQADRAHGPLEAKEKTYPAKPVERLVVAAQKAHGCVNSTGPKRQLHYALEFFRDVELAEPEERVDPSDPRLPFDPTAENEAGYRARTGVEAKSVPLKTLAVCSEVDALVKAASKIRQECMLADGYRLTPNDGDALFAALKPFETQEQGE